MNVNLSMKNFGMKIPGTTDAPQIFRFRQKDENFNYFWEKPTPSVVDGD